ncbi:hypothetical protein ONE63_006748 [Megalurothrips usitatus]|uniref:Ig-like domain-containing protein n=1 Tax=Megalurothrips usitatus TaxID=439358 RepID=A0AAV7XQQ1_9NEOP|nr:hypothetical protein ONE63_006748 [Megalurothrips usitatus]
MPGSATETISVLTLTAAAEDHGRQIECRAENALFADSEIRDQWQLDVQYSPRVAVRLGEQINASSIRVGGGVYLECSVDANPAAGLISWTHNVSAQSAPAEQGVP